MISPFNTLAYTKRCSLRCVRFSLSCFVVGWRDAFLTAHCSLLNHVVVFCLSLRRNCGLKRPSPPSPRTRNGTEDAIKMHAPTKPTTAATTIQMSTCVSEITSDNSELQDSGPEEYSLSTAGRKYVPASLEQNRRASRSLEEEMVEDNALYREMSGR